MMQYLSLLYLKLITEILTLLEPVSFSLICYIYQFYFSRFVWTSYLSRELSEIDTLSVQINIFIFQYSHGEYNVGPIMLYCGHYFVGFLSPNLLKRYMYFHFCFFTPFNKASETEGKGLQNCGQTSSVVWYLGHNERTRSTTRSK